MVAPGPWCTLRPTEAHSVSSPAFTLPTPFSSLLTQTSGVLGPARYCMQPCKYILHDTHASVAAGGCCA